jgi:hypothetical protein
MKPETRKFLDDMRASGMDISSIENQIASNPFIENKADSLIGGSILRQQDYQSKMNILRDEENKIKNQAQQLATLHDAKDTGVALPQEALDAIVALETELINTGLYDEDSVRNVSYKGKQSLISLTNPTQPNNNSATNPIKKEEPAMKTGADDRDFVEVNQFERGVANMAYGNMAVAAKLNLALDEARSLGLNITREQVDQFTKNAVTGIEKDGKSIDQIIDESFGLNTARQAAAAANEAKRLADERAAGYAEGLKVGGVPNRTRLNRGRHPILGRKTPEIVNSAADGNSFANDKGQIDMSKVPKNEVGDPKLFLLRGDRASRVEKASESFGKLMDRIEGDPLYGDV